MPRQQLTKYEFDAEFKLFSSYHRIYLMFKHGVDTVKYRNFKALNKSLFFSDKRYTYYVSMLRRMKAKKIGNPRYYDLFFAYMVMRDMKRPEYFVPTDVAFNKALDTFPFFLKRMVYVKREDIEMLVARYRNSKFHEIYHDLAKNRVTLVEFALLYLMGYFDKYDEDFFYKHVVLPYLEKFARIFNFEFYEGIRPYLIANLSEKGKKVVDTF